VGGWVGGGARGTGERGRNIESFPANAAPARAGLRTRRRIPTARRGVAGCNAHRVEVTYQMNINKRAQPPPSTPDFSLSLSLSLLLLSFFLSRICVETNFISAGVARARTRTTARIRFFLPAAPLAAVPNPGYGRSKWPGEKKMPSSRIFSSRRETLRTSSSSL